MNARRPLLPLACLVGSLLVLSACFGGYSPPPSPVAIAFVTPLPPTSVNLGSSFSVAAAVANTSNTEVNWTANPSSAGTFTMANTASGTPTSFMATMVPAGGSVTIIATSAADSTKFASAVVTINPGGAITVSFNAPPPPAALTVSGGGGTSAAALSATITSTVANAVSDGVDWTATCSVAGGCGSFSSNHTASGSSATTTYTAPASAPAGGLAVTVKATSTLDGASSVSAVIFVSSTTPAAFLCAGCSYTFTAAGVVRVAGGGAPPPYAIAGQFTADGMGNVKGGEQDYSDISVTTLNAPDTILSGNYAFTPDGRGTITLNTVARGAETLGVVIVSANHMLVTEFDTLATGSGTMDLQTIPAASFSQSTLSGGYAFVSGGTSFGGGAVGFGGVFNVPANTPGTISGTGSVCDENNDGNISTNLGLNGSYPTPDDFGRVQITLHAGFGPIILATYINDAAHLKFVEVDSNFGITAGFAVGQGAKTGSFTSASVLPANSSYVFTAFGALNATLLGPASLVTNFTSDGTSKLQNSNAGGAPNSDVNSAGIPSTGSITGTYSVDASGTGRVAVSLEGVPFESFTNIKNGTTPVKFAMYLTGGSDPALVLELDGYGITTGSAYTQTTSTFTLASISGSYGLNYTLFDPTGQIEYDATGQLLADGQGNLLGLQDINAGFVLTPGQATTGTYAQNGTGRFTGTVSSVATGPLQFSYYVVSPTQVVLIETDIQAVTLGLFQLQTPPF